MSEINTETNRYFEIEDPSAETPVKRLKYFVNGEFRFSETEKYMDCYNPCIFRFQKI